MGGKQWDYSRLLAREAGVYTPELEQALVVDQAVYEDVSKSRPAYVGAPDDYRRREYHLDRQTGSWEVHLPQSNT